MLEVVPCGNIVVLDKDIDAIVLQIIIEHDNVCYKLEWWSSNSRYEAIFHSSRVTTKTDNLKMKVGFKS